jgi:hypothetical protein
VSLSLRTVVYPFFICKGSIINVGVTKRYSEKKQ